MAVARDWEPALGRVRWLEGRGGLAVWGQRLLEELEELAEVG